MRIRNVDKNNDWRFGNGQSDYVRNAYAVILDIKLKIREWYQDCFFALDKGIEWDVRLGSHSQKELLNRDIYRISSEVEGVLNISDFESFIKDRRYTCSFKVYQAYSTEILNIDFDSNEVING